jgi:hypothetical protein
LIRLEEADDEAEAAGSAEGGSKKSDCAEKQRAMTQELHLALKDWKNVKMHHIDDVAAVAVKVKGFVDVGINGRYEKDYSIWSHLTA